MNVKNYSATLSAVREIFMGLSAPLGLRAGVIYGSSVFPRGFVHGSSDIDIMLFSEKLVDDVSGNALAAALSNHIPHKLATKPTYIDDYIAKRVEFYLASPDIPVDVTIFPARLEKPSAFAQTAAKDSMESLAGALYLHSQPLFGAIPDLDRFQSEYLPFYDGATRAQRLETLGPKVLRYNKRLTVMAQNRDPDILSYIPNARAHFVKWLFIQKKKYPTNPIKHFDYQLEDILQLPKKDVEALLFVGSRDIFSATKKYLSFCDRCFSEYDREKAQLNKMQSASTPSDTFSGLVHVGAAGVALVRSGTATSSHLMNSKGSRND